MRNIFFPKMKKGTFFSPTSGMRRFEVYLPLGIKETHSGSSRALSRTHSVWYNDGIPEVFLIRGSSIKHELN